VWSSADEQHSVLKGSAGLLLTLDSMLNDLCIDKSECAVLKEAMAQANVSLIV